MEALQNIHHSLSDVPGFTAMQQNSLDQALVKHAKDPSIGTFSGEELGKLVPLVAILPQVEAECPPVNISTRLRSAQVRERAHTLCRCAINSEDLLFSLKDVVSHFSASLGDPASVTCS